MQATIIAIGDELLVGQVVNTNATWLADRLTRIGWHVRRIVAVGDNADAMRSEIEDAARSSNAVIMCGGLGPTHDDRTRDVLCAMLGCGLVLDEPQLERIRQRFAERGIELNERSRRQAMVPEACERLANNFGSAPGLAFQLGAARLFALPGVPTELKGIFLEHIEPALRSLAGDIDQQTFLMFGIAESTLADALAASEPLLDDEVTLAYLPSPGGIRLRAMCLGSSPGSRERYAALLAIIRRDAASWMVSDRDESLMAATGAVFSARSLTLAAAESCTGGMIGSLLTDVPGSSAFFLGGVVAYANDVKRNMLGVTAEAIEAHGAVSSVVAESMAAGARRALGADIAIAVTGIAGPDGGSDGKPVGTVWIAIASARGVRSERHAFGRERDVVRVRAAYTAVELARREALAVSSI